MGDSSTAVPPVENVPAPTGDTISEVEKAATSAQDVEMA
jgi:hypothetical protein